MRLFGLSCAVCLGQFSFLILRSILITLLKRVKLFSVLVIFVSPKAFSSKSSIKGKGDPVPNSSKKFQIISKPSLTRYLAVYNCRRAKLKLLPLSDCNLSEYSSRKVW